MSITPASLFTRACLPLPCDAKRIVSWRNDPETLAASFHQEPKQWPHFWHEFHRDYFSFYPLFPLFTYDGNQAVGFIRFRSLMHPYREKGKTCDISIIINPRQRKKGYGKATVELGLAFLKKTALLDYVIADILPHNTTSLSLFKKVGFCYLGKRNHCIPEEARCLWTHCFHYDLRSNKNDSSALL